MRAELAPLEFDYSSQAADVLNNGHTLAQLGKDLPLHAGDQHALNATMLASQSMPETREYYRFSGSLTTPPCSDGVNWRVLKHPITSSEAQVEQLRGAMGHANARPVQPINARVIVK